MDGERLATALAILEPKQVAKLLNNLEPVSAAAVYTALDANHAVKALEQTDSRHCAEVLANNQLCKYILSRPYTTRVDLTHPQFENSFAARTIATMDVDTTTILNYLDPGKLAYIFEKGSAAFKPAAAAGWAKGATVVHKTNLAAAAMEALAEYKRIGELVASIDTKVAAAALDCMSTASCVKVRPYALTSP
eukprot:867332-Prorocentrum_minimum.AAC.2